MKRLIAALLTMILLAVGCGESGDIDKLNKKYRDDALCIALEYYNEDGRNELYLVAIPQNDDATKCRFLYSSIGSDIEGEFTIDKVSNIEKLVFDTEELIPYGEVVDSNGVVTKENWYDDPCAIYIEYSRRIDGESRIYFKAPSNINDIESAFIQMRDALQ